MNGVAVLGRFSGTPLSPRASTTFPQPHVCGSHALQPSLGATDILSCSSDSRRPTDVIDGADSQSPECGDAAARSLALSKSVEAWDQTSCSCFLQRRGCPTPFELLLFFRPR